MTQIAAMHLPYIPYRILWVEFPIADTSTSMYIALEVNIL